MNPSAEDPRSRVYCIARRAARDGVLVAEPASREPRVHRADRQQHETWRRLVTSHEIGSAHLTEQEPRADIHEAFLSLGCALICRQSLRRMWRTA
jgi:hypothetical protein